MVKIAFVANTQMQSLQYPCTAGGKMQGIKIARMTTELCSLTHRTVNVKMKWKILNCWWFENWKQSEVSRVEKNISGFQARSSKRIPPHTHSSWSRLQSTEARGEILFRRRCKTRKFSYLDIKTLSWALTETCKKDIWMYQVLFQVYDELWWAHFMKDFQKYPRAAKLLQIKCSIREKLPL